MTHTNGIWAALMAGGLLALAPACGENSPSGDQDATLEPDATTGADATVDSDGAPDPDGAVEPDAGDAQVCGPDELCDGIDNNCDGDIDEGCLCIDGQTRSCFGGEPAQIGVGICEAGVETCDLQGVWGPCLGEVPPDVELCNGLDDDCNGQPDDGLGTITCGLGICEVTVAACDQGQPATCIPGPPNPAGETCEGTDDDCDGLVDEGCPCVLGQTQPCYTGALATQNEGECHDGTQTCDALGVWGACMGEQTPSSELCNGLDDDCDTDIDENNPEGGGACSTGLPGVCAAGTEQCLNGQLDCVQNTQPSADLCDGLDNDCDPSTPDGSGDPLDGAACDGQDSDLCLEGTNSCIGGSIVCSDTSGDTVEICANGLDEDCDGTADNGCCAHAVCESGGPLDPTCEPCVAAVCAIDPWCCSNAWDEFCQEKVYAYCNSTCDGAGSGCTQCGTCSGADPLNPTPACGTDHHCKPQVGSGSPGLCIKGTGTSGYYGICGSGDDCVADATCTDVGAAVWAVCLKWCRLGSSDCAAGESCVGFTSATYIGTQEWGICNDNPAAWVCPTSYFGDGDCDCGCGRLDPDCVDATVGACDYCGDGCGTGSCPANIDPNENWHC